MAEIDRTKWNEKYSENLGGSEPSPVLTKYWNLASVGNALDIACGNGRNSIFLSQKGFVVDAVDISSVGTTHLAGNHKNINVICTDLDVWHIPQNRYELIVNIRFLDRRLFRMIEGGLKANGILIFETYLNGGKNKFCLRENELLDAFRSFRVVYYEEKKIELSEKFNWMASLVAVKPDGIG